MLKIQYSKQFKKDYKTMCKRGADPQKLESILNLLVEGKPLPPKNRNHALSGNYAGFYECHIQADWLLIYRVEEDVLTLVLTRTGTHSDLF